MNNADHHPAPSRAPATGGNPCPGTADTPHHPPPRLPTAGPHPGPHAHPRRLLAAFTLAVILTDTCQAALSITVHHGMRTGHLDPDDAAPLLLLGACAATGVINLTLAAASLLLSGHRRRPLALAATMLGIARAAGVLTAATTLAIPGFCTPTGVALPGIILALILLELAAATVVTHTALRRSTPG